MARPARPSAKAAALLLIGFLALAPTAPAQTRVLIGAVSDAETAQPLLAAQVSVKGLATTRAFTRDSGRFSITIPTSDVILVVRHLGYSIREIHVDAGVSALDVKLRRDPLRLDEVVVSGHASTISRRNTANAIAVVNGEDLTRVPAATIEHALQGKIAGAQIYQNTGAPGGGNRILIRGSSSITGSIAPLFVVDGMIISDVAIAPGLDRVTRAGGGSFAAASQENPVNRVADLNPDDIEDIEVLRGSSAAAMYGSKASGGVIMITTRRGRSGPTHLTLRSGIGTSRLSYKNGSRRFRTLQDARAVFDPSNALGDSAWATLYSADVHFDFEEMLYGQKPLNYETSVVSSGGSVDTRYLLSALTKRDEGIVTRTFADKKSVRINLDHDVGGRLTLALGSQLVRSVADRGLFGNENSPGGGSVSFALMRIPSFYDFRRRADGSFPFNPFWTSNPFQTTELFDQQEGVWRTLNSARVAYSAIRATAHELRFVANGGVDLLHQQNSVYSPPELQFEDDDNAFGTALISESRNVHRNLNLNAVHVYTPRNWFSLSSQFGTQLETGNLEITRTLGTGLIGGVPLPQSASFRDFLNRREAYQDFGVFAQSEALMSDRLLLTAGVRTDRGSNNGDAGKFHWYPKFAVSYRLPTSIARTFDELKVRAAYGETGNRPVYGAKFTILSSALIGNSTGLGVSSVRGSPDIHPERQRELEGGVDLGLVGGRGHFGLTGYQRNVSELLLNISVPPSLGYSTELTNGGDLRVRGLEADVTAFPIIATRDRSLSWNTRLFVGLNRTKVSKLLEPLPPFGSRLIDGQVFVEVGRSLTQMIGSDTVSIAGACPLRSIDLTGCDTLAVGATRAVYVGDASPRYVGGWSNEVRWRSVSIYGLFERQKGGLLRSTTWVDYDFNGNSRDYDEASPDLTKTLGRYRNDQSGRVSRIYLQDASYWKVREVTIGYDVPRQFVNRFFSHADNVRIIASGRNLRTWTKYRGGDPEFTNFGSAVPDALQRNRELGPYPPSRHFWLTAQVGF